MILRCALALAVSLQAYAVTPLDLKADGNTNPLAVGDAPRLSWRIESDKRGPDYGVPLVYQRDDEPRFFVPNNVHLIGLMNTADRSLSIVDYALRRRFAFMTLTPRFASDLFKNWLSERHMPDALVSLVSSRMSTLNAMISSDPLLGESYQVGHSFFCPVGEDFSDLNRVWYEGIVKTEIAPLLHEYWFDNPKRASEAEGALLAP